MKRLSEELRDAQATLQQKQLDLDKVAAKLELLRVTTEEKRNLI